MATVRETEVTEIYVATFNRAPDTAGLAFWVNSSLTIDEIAESFFDQKETRDLYPDTLSNTQFVNEIYNNLFNRDAESAGLTYWVAELDADTISRSDMILAVVRGALGTDDDILANKTEVGLYFAENGELLTYDQSVEVMEDVDATEGSVDDAKEQVDEWNGDAIALPTIDTIAGDDIVDEAEADAGFDITGTGIVGATVTVSFVDSETVLAGGNTAVVDADGNWSVSVVKADVVSMGEGGEIVTATQKDTEGNTSAAATQPIVVDTAPAPSGDLEITVDPAIDTWETISLTVNENAYVTTTGFSSDKEEEFFGGNSDTLKVEAQTAVTYGTINVTDMARVDSLMSDTTVYLGTNGKDNDNNTGAINGDANANLIFGFDSRDTLNGNGGNDELIGGEGKDKLYGGEGNDTLIIDDDDLVVDGGAGIDTVEFADDVDMVGETWSGIEVATATEEGAYLTLDSNAGQLTGLTTFNGNGADSDEHLVLIAVADQTIDASGITFNNGSGATITGSDGGDEELTGSNGDDTLYGLKGKDTLNGGAGEDSLYGNKGNDILVGGSGIDRLDGGAGADIFIFANGDSGQAAHDVITDFTNGDGDTITFGGPAAVWASGNWEKEDGGSTADLDAFLVKANAAMDTTVVYYSEHNVNGSGDGYLAYDSNADGTLDEVVKLDGLALNSGLEDGDIIA